MAITADAAAAWKAEKETLTADVEKTGTEIRTADAETEETETMTVNVVTEGIEIMIAVADQNEAIQGWIPVPLFHFLVREPAAAKDQRVMTDET